MNSRLRNLLFAGFAALVILAVLLPLFDTRLPAAKSSIVGWAIAGLLEVGIIAVAIWWHNQEAPGTLINRIGVWSPSHYLRKLRRARLLSAPFPDEWREILERNVAVYRLLTPEERARLRDDLRIVLEEHRWEGCAGLEITPEMQVTIAGLAAVLLLGIDHDYYAAVSSILVYPSRFTIPEENMGADGVIHDVVVLGQAWYRGPVVLAWDSVLAGGRSLEGRHNVVYHEFAHQLDFTGDAAGWSKGLSYGKRRAQIRKWQQVMHHEHRHLVHAVEHGMPTLLDPYGATNEREFFAVTTECFFQQPLALQADQPKLFEVLRDYYNQDPAARLLQSALTRPTGDLRPGVMP